MTKSNQTPKHNNPAKVDVKLLQQQVVALTDALQRERADATNIRRQHEDQLASLRTVVKTNVVRDLLPVIDNFERALKHVPTEQDHQPPATGHEDQKLLDWIDGVKKVLAQFEKTLAELGVERIKTVGEAFDPRYHEAVSMEEGDGSQEVVSEELQAGYRIGDDILRHAMVRVKLT